MRHGDLEVNKKMLNVKVDTRVHIGIDNPPTDGFDLLFY